MIRYFLISCLDTAQKNVREGIGAATARSAEEDSGGVFQEENYRRSLPRKETSDLNSEEVVVSRRWGSVFEDFLLVISFSRPV